MDLSHLLPALIVVPPAPFLIGTPEHMLGALAKTYGGTRESYREESPQHTLTLSAFAIAQIPVTNALYAQFTSATDARAPLPWRGQHPPQHLFDHPVVDVSWEDALAFCAWLSIRTGRRYRLPTEAEWEHAARGTDGRTFPWGEDWHPTYANTRECEVGGTTPVGSYPAGASIYGCLDMAGNVWEWTASLDAHYPYITYDGRERPGTPGRRILRGGCYANPQGFARCACRFRLPPAVRSEFLGFRLAADISAPS